MLYNMQSVCTIK